MSRSRLSCRACSVTRRSISAATAASSGPADLQRQAHRRAGISDVGGDVGSRLPAGRIRHRRERHRTGSRAAWKIPGRRDKFPLNLPPGFPLTTRRPEADAVGDAGGRARSMRSYRRGGRPASLPATRRCGGCFRTTARRARLFRSHRAVPDHARGRHPARRGCSSIPGSPRASTRRSRRPSAWPTPNSPKPLR